MLVIPTLLALIALPSWSTALDAVFKGNCDNVGTLQRSDDKGETFSEVVASSSWSNWGVTLTKTLSDVTAKTVVRVLCKDVGGVGAFIGQLEVEGALYYTAEDSLWTVLDDYTGALTYKANGISPWGAAPSSLDSDAMWIWNGATTYNTLTFDLDLGDLIDRTPNAQDAEFKGNCDNYGILQRSDDNGETFTEVVSKATWNAWTQTLTESLKGVTRNTVIRVVCEDVGVIGAFIGQVTVNGEVYYTKEGGDWDVLQGYSGDLTYKANGISPWGGAASSLDSNAMWIWNGAKTFNTLTFEFKFRSVLRPQVDAEFSGNCDNYGTLQRSDDNGETFTDLVGESTWNAWPTTLTEAVEDVTARTVIRVVCRDVGVIGAFIGQITVEDEVYYTEEDGAWSVIEDYEGDLTYKANGISPWGGAASSLDSNAMWIWNGAKIYNALTFEFKFRKVMDNGGKKKKNDNGREAEFKGNCDNYGSLQRSDDNGDSYSEVVAEAGWNAWTKTLTEPLEGVTCDTVIRVLCRDVGYIGAFIGQVTIDGEVYYTSNPLKDSEWKIIKDFDGELTYKFNGDSPWGGAASGVDADAYWIWNGAATYNTLTFEFKFRKVIGGGACQDDGAAAVAVESKPLISGPVSPRSPESETYTKPATPVNDDQYPRYYSDPVQDIVSKTSSVAATTTSNSMMYMMMLTCVLLFANIALITYTKCRATNTVNKYAKVVLDYDTEAEAQREVLRE